MSGPVKIAVVGGGITGLATAYYVQKMAREKNRDVVCTLIESSSRLGGKIVTDHQDEFTIEGGPDSFVTDKPWALQLCHELGLGEQLIPSNQIEKKVYVLHRGKLVQFPSGFRLTIPTEILPFLKTPLISLLGKLRMGFDYFIPPRKEDSDESLASFIRRRLGNEALERFAAPLMAGIYVADAEKLSMKSTFPSFLTMEKKYGSLIRAARAMKKNPPPRLEGTPVPAGNAMFNALRRGMGSLVDELAKKIPAENLLTGCRVTTLARENGKFALKLDGARSEEVVADAVVITTPAFVAADLIAPYHAKLAESLRQIRYVSTATVSFAYAHSDIPASRPLDGFGVMIPAGEKRSIIACTWASTKFRHRAPPGCVLLRAFVGGSRDEAAVSLPDDELVEIVRREYRDLFGISAEPLLHKIYRWIRGNPQYDVGHLDRVSDMENMAAEIPGLHLAGSAYRGIGMPDCINSARQVAEKIVA